MLRGLLAVLAGFLLVTNLPTYGGIGINILFFAADRGIPLQGQSLYKIVGIYSVAMTILLLALAFLLLTEFTSWKFRYTRGLVLIVAPSLLALSLIHLAAFLNIVRIPDLELKELFIDSSVYHAALTLISLVLFALIHWMRNVGQIEKI